MNSDLNQTVFHFTAALVAQTVVNVLFDEYVYLHISDRHCAVMVNKQEKWGKKGDREGERWRTENLELSAVIQAAGPWWR